MRNIEYLSPTAISLYRKDAREFYMHYLADVKAPRAPQTQPMAIGNAFDAYVKSFLHAAIFGAAEGRFELKTLFEAQVEPHNRDWAWEHGEYAFKCYRESGALADLLLELQSATNSPRFEIEVKGAVNGTREAVIRDIGPTLLGKPDVFYINKHGTHVILDFKVNGWQSKYNISPMPGYLRIRTSQRQVSGAHKNCIPMQWNGSVINCSQFFETLNADWAQQLTIYAWLCGVPVGGQFICAIDQLVCKPVGKFPDVRIAEHRLRVSDDYQHKLFETVSHIWDVVHSNHVFRDVSLEDSQSKCKSLDEQANQLRNPQTEDDVFFNMMTR